MGISCPYCGHGMKVKRAKPGRYKPKCSQCERRFTLTVPDTPDGAIEVGRLPSNAKHGEAEHPHVSAGDQAAPSPSVVPRPEDATHDTIAMQGSVAPTDQTVDDAAPESAPPVSPLEQTAFMEQTTPDVPASGSDRAAAVDQTAPIDQTAPMNIAHDVTTPGKLDATLGAVGDVAGQAASSVEPPLEHLGGYKILKVLGRGAMGTVYLANQTSLDRQVALKTIQARWCENPATVARFTREAYAAAQLTHHNVVQIYDLGADQGVNFYSMEFVKGVSLDELIAQHGKVDPEAAAGYILQAARGLGFAHSHGMVHRDVKPANLMLSDLGIVKVADLGLVKTPQMVEEENSTVERAALAASTANVTLANMAIGTPAYMAPEQAENATGVDHRADIYSLGCTLYVLLTGRTPFEGATALEVITKHKTEMVVRPEKLAPNVPGPISDIVVRMIAKNPDERFASLEEVIESLEGFLGEGTQPISEEHVAQLEAGVARYNSQPLAKIRGLVAIGFTMAMILLAVASVIFSVAVAGGWLTMLAAAATCYFVVGGLRQHGPLFDKVRELIFSCRWTEWITWTIGGLALLAVAMLVCPVAIWLGFGLVGAALGTAFYFVFDRQLASARREPTATVEDVLKKLRIRGLDEPEIQQFFAKYAGNAWEEMFEALFGYNAKLAARLAMQQAGQRPGRAFRGWRDPLIKRINGYLRRTREARDRKHLATIEAAGLQASGVDATHARQQAENMATAMLDHAAAARRELAAAYAAVDPKIAAEEKRARIKAMLAEARSGKFASQPQAGGFLKRAMGFFGGAKLRFLSGCVLLAGCLLWMRQLGLFASADGTIPPLDTLNLLGPSEPLKLPVVGVWFDSFNPGFAGLMLVFTAFFRGWKMSLFAIPAAVIMVCGPALGMPGVAALGGAHTTSLVIGGTIAAVGLVFGRTREDLT